MVNHVQGFAVLIGRIKNFVALQMSTPDQLKLYN